MNDYQTTLNNVDRILGVTPPDIPYHRTSFVYFPLLSIVTAGRCSVNKYGKEVQGKFGVNVGAIAG